MLYFEGGGACFSAETCSFESGNYKVTAAPDGSPEGGSGIFDFDDPANPFADWSMVYVPYCTGDVHIGDNLQEYGPDLTVAHVGFVNASAATEHMVAAFPDATEVFVTGSSAGGVPSPMFGALVADEIPGAEVQVLADGSGAYPDNPPVNAAIGALWGAFGNAPDWPVNEDITPEEWSLPGLFVQGGLHRPDVRMARYDDAYDQVQQFFSGLANVGTDDLLEIIQINEQQIEDAGVPIHSYIAPGAGHTILGRPEVYTLEVEGVAFIDWLTDYVAGEAVADVVCVDCEKPEPDEDDQTLDEGTEDEEGA